MIRTDLAEQPRDPNITYRHRSYYGVTTVRAASTPLVRLTILEIPIVAG